MSNSKNQENSSISVRFALSIPPRDLDVLGKIVDMEGQNREALWAAIDTAPLGASTDELKARIIEGASLTEDEAGSITAMLSRMYFTKERSEEIRPEEFVEAVVLTVAAEKKVEANDSLRSIMRKLLSFDILGIKSRAEQVMQEYERLMDKARILTDIRPVFNKDAAPVATLVIHNLRIRHIDNEGQMKDFFVAMDGKDLRNLANAIERATKKEATLRAFMAKSGMLCIETETDD